MAASLARGNTVLHNSAREPEIVDLVALLNGMGARIEGAGTGTISIEGVDALHGATHCLLPDRIECGTFLVAAALVGEEVAITACRPELLTTVLDQFRRCGVPISCEGDRMIVRGAGEIVAGDMSTSPYPGFPTDLQAQYMVLMTQARGVSSICETIFENRFMHVPELQRLGARILVSGGTASVEGGHPLSGAPLMATDLRASASLVLAGLVAHGVTRVRRVYHLDRGYERLEEKLSALGAEVERIRE